MKPKRLARFAPDRRNFLQSLATVGGLAWLDSRFGAIAQAQPRAAADVPGLRDKIDHIIVVFQENRSFDHYFGAYQSSRGEAVDGLLNREGHIDARFTGIQRNAAGVPYANLPLPHQVPGFASALLPNRPFHLSPYIPPQDNVPWDPMHTFFRMFAQIDDGKMDRFVALAARGRHRFFERGRELDAAAAMLAESTPSGAVLGFYTRDDLPDYHRLADEYVLFDRFFQAMSGGSTGNALYLVAGRSAQWSTPPPDPPTPTV